MHAFTVSQSVGFRAAGGDFDGDKVQVFLSPRLLRFLALTRDEDKERRALRLRARSDNRAEHVTARI